ncbi:MAG: hypothetical protein H0T62_06485 [Parachlamydiaceae bacterium]|nr:hypothetical protein [Parachlamydiaceae bacterium]
MKKYSILTLSRFHDQLERLIKSILVAQPDISLNDIYVVDDGLPDDFKEKWKGINYILGEQPFIFARNFNIGLKSIPIDRDLFFIGDDAVLLTLKGIDRLAETAYNNSKIGMAGTSVNGAVGNYYQKFGVLQHPTTREELRKLDYYHPTLMFVAVYLKRELIDVVGDIPESLVGYGFEDNYYSLQMAKLNYTWIIDPTVVVFHGWGEYSAGSSFYRRGLNPVEMIEVNRKIFKEISEDADQN